MSDPEARRRERWVLVLTGVASLMVSLDAVVVATALSTMQRELGASVAGLEWTINAYNLCFAVLMMTAAVVSDRIGRRRTFLIGMVAFSWASAACALAPSVGILIAARAIQGMGGAFVLPVAGAILGAAIPVQRRGHALGVFAGVTGIALLLGPVVGGGITQGLSWHWIFWLNVPIGLAVIPLARRRLPESHGPRAQIDALGVVLITGGLLGVVWGLVRTDSAGWGSVEVLATLIGGVLSLGGFVAWELRAASPMLPVRIFRERAFAVGNGAMFLTSSGLVGSAFFVPQLLQRGMGHDALAAGLGMLPWTAPMIVIGPRAGRVVDTLGARPVAILGSLLQAAGILWMALAARPGSSYGSLVPGLVLAGSGPPLVITATQAAVLGSVRADEVGKASSSFYAARQVGAVFGIAVCVAVFAGAGSYASAASFVDGFGDAAYLATGLSVLAALIAWQLPRRRRPLDAATARAPGAVETEAAG